MKLKYNFIINELGDTFVAVPVENSAIDFNGILKLNDSAAYIIEQLNSEVSFDDLCLKVADNFNTTEDDARKNVENIVSNLRNANLILE